jgi:hypothetical protein
MAEKRFPSRQGFQAPPLPLEKREAGSWKLEASLRT